MTICELRFALSRLATSDVALLQAPRAHVHLALVAIHDHGDALDVWTELAIYRAERVCNGTTGNGMLAADLTNFRHDRPPMAAPWRRCGHWRADSQNECTIPHACVRMRLNQAPPSFTHLYAEQTSNPILYSLLTRLTSANLMKKHGHHTFMAAHGSPFGGYAI